MLVLSLNRCLPPTLCNSYLSHLVIDQGKLKYILLLLENTRSSIGISIVSVLFLQILLYMWSLRFLALVQLSHYIHINTAKVNILKSCPRLCPLSLGEDKGFFFLPSSQATITALIYLPGIKCWWVPVSSGWHLFHQRSQSRGRGTLTVGMKKKKRAACIPSQRMWWNC